VPILAAFRVIATAVQRLARRKRNAFAITETEHATVNGKGFYVFKDEKSRRGLYRRRIGTSTVSAALYTAARRAGTGRGDESPLRPELGEPIGRGPRPMATLADVAADIRTGPLVAHCTNLIMWRAVFL
jgi:hypothetical protein